MYPDLWMCVVGILMGGCRAELSDPAMGATDHSRDMATCKHVVALVGKSLVASQIDILDSLNLLNQYGLTLLKPLGKEEARHGIAWAVTVI